MMPIAVYIPLDNAVTDATCRVFIHCLQHSTACLGASSVSDFILNRRIRAQRVFTRRARMRCFPNQQNIDILSPMRNAAVSEPLPMTLLMTLSWRLLLILAPERTRRVSWGVGL